MSKKDIKLATATEQPVGVPLEIVKTAPLAGKAIEILECDKKGIVKFKAPLSQLGLSVKQAAAFKTQKKGFLADAVGETLVRENFDKFSILMDNKRDYARFCETFEHKRFVASTDNRQACFRFHISLLRRIYNDILNESIPDSKALNEDDYICSLIEPGANAGHQTGCRPDNVLRRFLKEKEWNYLESNKSNKDRIIIESGIHSHNGKYPVRIILWLKREWIMFHSYLPVAVPEEKRMTVAEYITRANYNMIFGGFEMDYRDGEVNCKTSLIFTNDRLSLALLRELVTSNTVIFNRYWPGFFKIIYSDGDPVTTVKEIENKE